MLKSTFDLSCAANIIGALDIIENAKIETLCNDATATTSGYAAQLKNQIYSAQIPGLNIHEMDVEVVFELYRFFVSCSNEWGDYGPCHGGLLTQCMTDCIHVLLAPNENMVDIVNANKP